MTQEEIIRMTRQAGWEIIEEQPAGLLFRLERFSALVAAHEREACAKVCEELEEFYTHTVATQQCAAAIRARGDK